MERKERIWNMLLVCFLCSICLCKASFLLPRVRFVIRSVLRLALRFAFFCCFVFALLSLSASDFPVNYYHLRLASSLGLSSPNYSTKLKKSSPRAPKMDPKPYQNSTKIIWNRSPDPSDATLAKTLRADPSRRRPRPPQDCQKLSQSLPKASQNHRKIDPNSHRKST